MTTAFAPALAPQPVAGLRDVVSGLLADDLSRLDSDALVGLLREVEVQVRRLAAVDHAVIAEIERRGVAHEQGLRDTAQLVCGVLRVSPAQARARVCAARDLGPRSDSGGQPLAPVFPHVAAAQAAGSISVRHASVIVEFIDRLPGQVQAESGALVEQWIVADALTHDPAQLAVIARRREAHLNPDGILTRERDHDRRRHGVLRALQDGSGQLDVHLTPAALACWQAILDSLTAPAPATDSTTGERTPDLRSAGQRIHDAVFDIAQRLLRSATLPDAGGAPATVLITMTLDQLETRTGIATTAHGGDLSITQALQLADEADLIPTILNSTGGILAYGHQRRCASPAQTRALTARDQGCTFPGCDTPPSWTQAHHIIEWTNNGPTDLNNLTLLCGHHHRTFHQTAWTCHITDGIPQWIPPPWLDPQRKPRHNQRI